MKRLESFFLSRSIVLLESNKSCLFQKATCPENESWTKLFLLRHFCVKKLCSKQNCFLFWKLPFNLLFSIQTLCSKRIFTRCLHWLRSKIWIFEWSCKWRKRNYPLGDPLVCSYHDEEGRKKYYSVLFISKSSNQTLNFSRKWNT